MTTLEAPPTQLRGESEVQAAEATDRPRPLRAWTFDDWACLGASFFGSFGLVWLFYEYLLPFDGRIGFFICWYLAFVAVYLGTTALSNPLTVVIDRLASTLVHGGAVFVLLAMITVVGFPFVKGYHALFHTNFVTHAMNGVGPRDSFDKGGVLHAIVGTLVETGIAIAVALPLGVGAAVYMTESRGKFSRVVRTIVEAMTALPSVVAGLFVYTIFVVDWGIPRSGIDAAVALTIMMLPIIARASDVVLRVVPGGLREASLALGASRWRTVWNVVLPTVRPGLATAAILGIARAVGETSPVLLTSGANTILVGNPINGQPMNSLPLFTYEAVRSGDPVYEQRGFASACVLLTLVLILFIIARVLARQRVR